MKIKLSQLNPNPFKKEINKGKLDEDTIKKIQSNMKELGLMGSLPIFRKDNKCYLVAGHHRVEALKRQFGKNFEINVDVHNYSEDQILRGMIVENLTQRNNEYAEEEDNILAIRKYLKQKKMLLDDKGLACPPVGHVGKNIQKGVKGFQEEYGSINQICLWLDKDKGEVMRRSKIGDLLIVHEKLNPELREKIDKVGGGKAPDDTVTVKQAIGLVRITDDPKEQKELWDAMKKAEGRPHELLTEYKRASPEIKKKVREGEINLQDVKIEEEIEETKKRYEEIQKQSDEEIKIVKSGEIIENLRKEITLAEKDLSRFIYKVKVVRFRNLSWKNNNEQVSFQRFIESAIKKARTWVDTLENIRDDVGI